MDVTEQPSVTYGAASPYTDYSVHSAFVSKREWVGEITISPIMNSGTMYWKTVGGVAADDHWLECGEDILRFSFNISTTGTLAMLLNASGGANKVELSWAQNDYETLAGYNIYRSTSPDSGFVKINNSIIIGTEYTDTNVDPGVMYYYYFKVVNTDGNEEESVSNIASAAPIDNIFPVLKHTPITRARAGALVTVSATATDNIEVADVMLYYRKVGDASYQQKNMTLSATEYLYVAVIPSSAVTGVGVEYYITATDADGNITYEGTAQLPNAISVNANTYISGITPSKVSIDGGTTIAILGGNFNENLTLKVGNTEIAEMALINDGQINFTAPKLPSGSYAVTLTTADGTVVSSPTGLSYSDASSIAQIPTKMTMVSNAPYVIPFYATASGEIISLHAELDLPTSYFSSVTVEKADENAAFNLDYTYKNGVLKIGCIGASDINTDSSALINIIVVPMVSDNEQLDIALHDVSFNGVAVNTVISGTALLKPSFVVDAYVKYFSGSDKAVSDITISIGGIKTETDEKGKASLTVSERNVTVTASCQNSSNAITAFDASLVLQSAIDKITLDDYQTLAADVDGNGSINEYDAALILQKSVRKIDSFPSGTTWVFYPAYIEKTLGASINSVTFTAIAVGDVDGSYGG